MSAVDVDYAIGRWWRGMGRGTRLLALILFVAIVWAVVYEGSRLDFGEVAESVGILMLGLATLVLVFTSTSLAPRSTSTPLVAALAMIPRSTSGRERERRGAAEHTR